MNSENINGNTQEAHATNETTEPYLLKCILDPITQYTAESDDVDRHVEKSKKIFPSAGYITNNWPGSQF